MKTRTYAKAIITTIFMTIVVFHSGCTEQIVPPVHTVIPGDSAWVYLGLKGESIQSIAVDPTNPEIIYAGSLYNFSESTPGRLFKSFDGGKNWDTLLASDGAQFIQIVIDSKNHNIIYAASWGLIKSYDGGVTWQDVNSGIQINWETHIQALVIDPINSAVLYAGSGGPMGGKLYKTTNAGISWEVMSPDSSGDGITSIAIDFIINDICYIGTEFGGALAKSTDSGNHWMWPGFSCGVTINTITIDPGNNQRILIGTSGVNAGANVIWKSDNGGNNFQVFMEGIPNNVKGCSCLLFNSALQCDIYEAGYGVCHKKEINSPWTPMEQGLPIDSRIEVLALGKDYYLYAGLRNIDTLEFGGVYRRRINH